MSDPSSAKEIQVVHKDRSTFRVGKQTITLKSNLAVRQGEIVVVMGASGAGKTALCEAVMDHRAGDAMIHQRIAGLSHLTVEQNLRLVPSAEGNGIKRTADTFRLGLQRRTRSLGADDRRRLALARGVLAGAPVIWVDSPETGLDPGRVRALARTLRDLVGADDPPAMVLVTQSAELAALVRPWRVAALVREGAEARFQEIHSASNGKPPAPAKPSGPLRPVAYRDSPSPPSVPADPEAEASDIQRGITQKLRELCKVSAEPPLRVGGGAYGRRRPIALASMWRTLRLTVLSTQLVHFVAAGAGIGLLLVTILSLLERAMGGAAGRSLVADLGPYFLVEAAPVLASIFVMATAGVVIASRLGQLAANRELSGLEVLGVRVRRRVLWPIGAGLFVSTLAGMAVIVAVAAAAFLGYPMVEAGAASMSAVTDFGAVVMGLGTARLLSILLEFALYAGLIAALTVIVASRSTASSPRDPARVARRALVQATLAVMLTKLALMLADLWLGVQA